MSLIEQAKQWLAQDPDPETRAELQTLLQHNDKTALEKRFAGRLAFGTAGLRGPLQAGPLGMNRVLVAQAAGGLARYLKARYPNPSVVIGYDARKNSAQFARDTAEIMQGAGVNAYLFGQMVPTPVLAYAVRALPATAGVMVTASHNPPQDNGYKVYLGNQDAGAQIIPPADADIAAEIAATAGADIRALPRQQDYTVLDDALLNSYIARTAALIQAPQTTLNYVYTALHGVGCQTLLKTLEQAGMNAPHLVSAQCTPDGSFPTVRFPNPEEPGALDMAIALAQEHKAELILANDPDADRLAVAIPDEQGQWHMLHGNTTGCYLAAHIAEKARAAGRHGTLACSLVSSPALAVIAKYYGMDYQSTLTGFKWIGRVENLLFGYEEALGYLVDADKVHDKDGISAAMMFLDLLLTLKQQGRTLQDYAADFAEKFGAYAAGQVAIRVDDLAKISDLMQALRHCPPKHIGTAEVRQFTDYLQTSWQSNIVCFDLANGGRVIARPSGTEPKIKFYLDVCATDNGAAANALQQLDRDLRALLRQEQYGQQPC